MMEQAPFRTYARYLRERHGTTVYRVAVDAGFGCPNRPACDRTTGGCTYCAADGARAPYQEASVAGLEAQVRDGMAFLRRRYDARAFILYFQAYSNTYAPVETLRRIYDAGLALGPFVGMNVATRPDCIDEEKAQLLAGYATPEREVWVEMGLQSAHDATLARIGRGHTMEEFRAAYATVKSQGIKVAVHLIFGLPGENAEDIRETVAAVAALRPDGVKLHNLHVVRGTRLAAEHARGEITAPCPARHLSYLVEALEGLPPETVIMRMATDTPSDRLLAPRGAPAKGDFIDAVAAALRARGTVQGSAWRPLP
jgi:uncharacterized protein